MQTLSLARALIRAGYAVTVCCYYEYDEGMAAQFRSIGAKLVLMGLERGGAWQLIHAVKKQLREARPDVVHVQYVAPGLLPIIAARWAGVRTVLGTVHQPGRTYGWKNRMLLRLGAGLCTTFLCVSQAAEKSWFGRSQMLDPDKGGPLPRHATLYNAVDVDRIESVVAAVNVEAEKAKLGIVGRPVVGIVARLRAEKGQAVLLRAMAQVIQKVPQAVLLSVGDGPDAQRLRELSDSLGLANHVIWLGQQSQEQVYRLYALMDAVAVPSMFEGFGLSAAEAMAAGKPVVATDVDGLCEVVQDKVTGFLVRPDSPPALAAGIEELLMNRERAIEMGQQGRFRANAVFSFARYARRIEYLYSLGHSMDPMANLRKQGCPDRRMNGRI